MAAPLAFDASKCTDCRVCERLCSFVHHRLYNLHKSGIRISVQWPGMTQASVCHQCGDSPCQAVCPTTALFLTPEGVVKFDAAECTECGACIEACPYDAIWQDPTTGWIVKCDTCDGEYRCIGWCQSAALSVAVAEGEVR
jgi:Fe-S-cluster-containing hydrogenase component 2